MGVVGIDLEVCREAWIGDPESGHEDPAERVDVGAGRRGECAEESPARA